MTSLVDCSPINGCPMNCEFVTFLVQLVLVLKHWKILSILNEQGAASARQN